MKKKDEEQQMNTVLKEYKTRFVEFDKSIRQSRKTLQQYEKEIASMNRTINQLNDQKRKVILTAARASLNN